VSIVDIQRFKGGGGAIGKALAVGVIGMVGVLAAMLVSADRKPVLFAYLIGFAFWAGIAMGSLILLMIWHAFRAKWPVVVRRPLEAMASTVPLFLVLAIPLLIPSNLELLYSWVNPAAAGIFTHHELGILERKASYLNTGFFIARTVFYFVIAAVIASRLFRLSVRQDETGEAALTQKQRNLGTGALPLMALVITFAAFDWLMSLNPIWFSTIFGVYYFSGSFWSTLAILIITSSLATGRDLFGRYVSPEHLQNLGKLLFAFTCFWAYIGFSQMMLIWMANLPEEIPFFIVRMKGPWATWGVALILGHFVIPFAILLSRDIKRKPRALSLVAVWVLLMHLVDLIWLVLPTLDPNQITLHWSLLFALLGPGGLGIAYAIWKIRGHYTVPVRDPFLEASLRYRQPV
jgi:hypothetical protein